MAWVNCSVCPIFLVAIGAKERAEKNGDFKMVPFS